MSLISKFTKKCDHYCITEYTLECCICGKHGCDICARIGRGVRTPNIDVNGKNIRDEVLRVMDLPIIDPSNKDHFLSYDETRLYIDNKKPSVNELISNLSSANKVTSKTKRLSIAKKRIKGKFLIDQRSEYY